MGHIGLLVQGQGVDLSRASRILVCTLHGGGVLLAAATHRREYHIVLASTSPISDIILILDRCSVYSTRIACHRMGISCIVRLFELVHSQCMQ